MRGRKAGFWSPVEDEFLLTYRDDLTADSLSSRLGKSENAIRTRLKEFGVTKAKIVHRKDRVVRVCQNPLCADAFEARQYEVDRGTGRYCSESCVHQSQRIEVPDEDTLKSAYAEGMSTNDLAQQFKVSKGTIYNLFKAYGVQARSLSEANDVASRSHSMGGYGVIKGGSRTDLGGLHVRSGWEANVARWMNHEGIVWEYEPTRFHFPIKRGTKSYCPDFWLPNYMGGKWLEVKGHIPAQDKTRMKRFKLHCPDEFSKLMVITGSPNTEASAFFEILGAPVMAYYRDLNKQFKDLPHWGE